MKDGIHPEYKDVSYTCSSCNTVIESKSTSFGEQALDVCSSCHPFFTGKQKLMDTAGRVERFRRKYAKAEAK